MQTSTDPAQAHELSSLLSVVPPEVPPGFASFWQQRYEDALRVSPEPQVRPTGSFRGGFEVCDLSYRSTGDVHIHGWLLRPTTAPVLRVIIGGHGYGGCDGPSDFLPLADAAYLFPCYRGISRSHRPGLPANPDEHVVHGIGRRDTYILGGCVEDTWLAVSAAAHLFPEALERIAYMGISFSGGIGVLALPWDRRLRLAHVQVPSFGHQPLRMSLPSVGSAAAVQRHLQQHPEAMDTLLVHDAAVAARFVGVPVHVAAALCDPCVTPPGQFAIFNGLPGQRHLFVLEKGHSDYAGQHRQQQELQDQLQQFFRTL